uniref:Uncharacterized protein n=1 Tax=Wuchereria bancrofti TaxID=6293 RepID=A0A1I8EY78_WUCBA
MFTSSYPKRLLFALRRSNLAAENLRESTNLILYYHSTTSTPTSSAIIQESIMNITTAGCDLGSHASAETLPRPSRAYRIIDSNISQKILQQLVADKLAAAQTTGKGTKFLKRKGSSKGTTNFFFQRQSNFGSQIWNRTDELPLISKAPIFRTHCDVVRTSSFSGNQTQIIRKHLDYNRNSLPVNITALNNDFSVQKCYMFAFLSVK